MPPLLWRKGRNLNLTRYGNEEPSSSFSNLSETQLTLKEWLENYSLCNGKTVAFTGPINLISFVNDWRVKEQFDDLTLH